MIEPLHIPMVHNSDDVGSLLSDFYFLQPNIFYVAGMTWSLRRACSLGQRFDFSSLNCLVRVGVTNVF